ncbi:MAG: hypothetical protein ACYDD1_15885, partial [Caulobacteraceae bacterium]
KHSAMTAPVKRKRDSHQHSMRNIILQVAGELETMRENGYNLDELAEFLKGKGVPIAAPTLASYLRVHRIRDKGKPKPGGKTDSQTEIAKPVEDRVEAPVAASAENAPKTPRKRATKKPST